MACVRFEGRSFPLQENESALDALLRGGAPVAHSCKAGICGSCLLRAVEGDVPERAQAGLKDAWKARGYVLACACVPTGDLTLAPVDADTRAPAQIVSLTPLSTTVMGVELQCLAPWEFRAGQYVTVLRPDGLARSYSLASLPADGHLRLHVRRVTGGRMSEWWFGQARPGDAVTLLGPSGECFYVPGREDQPLLLAGAGTGLAPLYGILRDALAHGHRGAVHLFHGALTPEGLYLRPELTALAAQHANVSYTPAVLHDGESAGLADQPIDQAILSHYPKLDGWRAFVCGDPALVAQLRKKIFLAGAASRDIHADAFLPSAPPAP